MISFTFDDFPRSALTVAGEMLMAHGWRGTYYGSMGLLGKVTALGPMFTREDLDTLLAAGHELACHTLDHTSCMELATAEVADACAENRRQAAAWLDGYQLRNMSFPYGHVTLAAKHSLQSAYDTCRSIKPGINVDPVDRGFLRANPVYSHLEGDPLKQLIEANTQGNGWLILYTHDVATDPSPYGCTPQYFEKVLRYAAESGAEVLPICKAAARYLIAPIAGHEIRAEILPSSRL
jgi:peptidoglycan/xylan/chitin deacetylase (PgdA/CDA1 family)